MCRAVHVRPGSEDILVPVNAAWKRLIRKISARAVPRVKMHNVKGRGLVLGRLGRLALHSSLGKHAGDERAIEEVQSWQEEGWIEDVQGCKEGSDGGREARKGVRWGGVGAGCWGWDGGYRVEQRVLCKSKRVLSVLLRLVEVVEEDAAHTAALAPVLVVEVFVTPFLEARVVVLVVVVTRLLERLVEVHGVLVEQVRRRQVAAATEPPCMSRTVGVRRLKVSVVQVDRRRHGVLGVQHHAETSREEGERVNVLVEVHVLVVGAHLGDSGLGEGTVDNTDADTTLLKDVSVLENAGDAAATLGALPLVPSELGAVELLQLPHNLVLLLFDELLHSQAHRGVAGDARLLLGQGIALGKGRAVELVGFLNSLG
ncbi:hypothetical protein BN1708_005818 [Verticillium longisporum]|uniref:Uncharacterized protein n=1 Tax=Verticillium longisporum TaxID=100787 RepID=A0A0G4ME26_VERLO|nr:hypothetical protein BN1708_005818 [Verticillium longisporum]